MGFNYDSNEAIADPTASFSDMFSVFFDDGEITNSWGTSSSEGNDEDEDNVSGHTTESDAAFWDAQNQLLHDAMHRSSSVEKRVRAEMEVMQTNNASCKCSSRLTEGLGHCRKCAMQDVADRLLQAGYSSAICKSKWRKTADIPSGEHSYIDVLVETKKAGTVRVVIELTFRAEFEMARASQEYNSLVGSLPEVFVGKPEKLRAVIKIVCAAAKKCMKDNKMHLAPWRKHKYMQSKWLATCQRLPAGAPVVPVASVKDIGRQSRQRASMLTFDLHCAAAVAVL